MNRLLRIAVLGARSLFLHPARSFLTALGIIIGVGTVIYMLAIIEGRSEDIQAKIRARGATNILIRAKKPSEEGTTASRNRLVSYGLTYEDARRIRENLKNVEVIVPVREVASTVYKETRSSDTVVYGTVPWFPEVSKAKLDRGRWFSDLQSSSGDSVIILGSELNDRLFGYRDAVGDTVRVGSKVFTVIGVLKSTVTSDETEGAARDRAGYIPMGAVRERFGERNVKRSSGVVEMEEVELHQILVKVDKMKNVGSTSTSLIEMLKRSHKKEDYVIDVPLKLLAEAQDEQEKAKRLFGSIAAISLLVGGIGIMNIMLASVTERTREIGIRRALGAHRRDITSQFLTETLILSVLGGLIGVGAGFLATQVHINRMDPTDPMPIITAESVILSFGISAVVGVVAGLYPAVRASRMDPIKALRHE